MNCFLAKPIFQFQVKKSEVYLDDPRTRCNRLRHDPLLTLSITYAVSFIILLA